ncbi:hypothetical protein PIB30_064835, partial [Stylosanthes scabra]|nr:hypothetical protein [Stylosanthes scabra]
MSSLSDPAPFPSPPPLTGTHRNRLHRLQNLPLLRLALTATTFAISDHRNLIESPPFLEPQRSSLLFFLRTISVVATSSSS